MSHVKKVIGIILLSLFVSIIIPNAVPIANVSTVEAAKVKISKSKATLMKGETLNLSVKNSSSKVKWSTSNKKIATVTSKGKVKAKAAGTVTITAKVGNKEYSCKLTVETPKISSSKLTLSIGTSETISVIGTNQKVKWSTSNKKIVTVDKKGTLTAKKKGSATITAKIGSKSYKCKVTVNTAPSIGSITNPHSAYDSFTSDIYYFSKNLGNFTIKLVDYKSGNEAYKLLNEYATVPAANQEYIYLKFNIKYNSGSAQVHATDVINYYANIFNSNSTVALSNEDWAYIDDDTSIFDTKLSPGANVTCYTAVLVKKGNTPITYRMATGYDTKNFRQTYEWFKIK